MVKLVSKIIYLDSKNTCIRLCHQEWEALDYMCKDINIKRRELINKIRICKNDKLGLTPAIRLFTLIYYKNKLAPNKTTDLNNLLSEIS